MTNQQDKDVENLADELIELNNDGHDWNSKHIEKILLKAKQIGVEETAQDIISMARETANHYTDNSEIQNEVYNTVRALEERIGIKYNTG